MVSHASLTNTACTSPFGAFRASKGLSKSGNATRTSLSVVPCTCKSSAEHRLPGYHRTTKQDRFLCVKLDPWNYESHHPPFPRWLLYWKGHRKPSLEQRARFQATGARTPRRTNRRGRRPGADAVEKCAQTHMYRYTYAAISRNPVPEDPRQQPFVTKV